MNKAFQGTWDCSLVTQVKPLFWCWGILLLQNQMYGPRYCTLLAAIRICSISTTIQLTLQASSIRTWRSTIRERWIGSTSSLASTYDQPIIERKSPLELL
jgi:hypothetical protein